MPLLNVSGRGADAHDVDVNELVLVQGMRDTKLTLARWNRDPLTALRPWCILSAAIAALSRHQGRRAWPGCSFQRLSASLVSRMP